MSGSKLWRKNDASRSTQPFYRSSSYSSRPGQHARSRMGGLLGGGRINEFGPNRPHATLLPDGNILMAGGVY